jgi:IS30 family transposase
MVFCNDNIKSGVIPCATTNILYFLSAKSYYFFLAKGYTLTRIADKLGRNKSTISRELRRNASKKHYLPIAAEKKARQRRSRCHPHKKIG